MNVEATADILLFCYLEKNSFSIFIVIISTITDSLQETKEVEPLQ